MYNKTLRKITSLSLLTILLTSTAAFALPNALPAAHASTNANLFVSAESSQFNNYFSGPQVVQVIVSDPSFNRLDQGYGEPIVTVNGKKLRMAQNTDGNWYAYFADSKSAQIADSTAPVKGFGLNFGEFCSATSAITATGVDFTETKGVAIASNATGSVNGTQTPGATVSATCGASPIVGLKSEHVIRENKTLTHVATGVTYGQIGFTRSNVWPVIQLYDFSGFPTTVTVDYHKAGGDQVSTLTFDRIPQNIISMSNDRSSYPQDSNVFLTMNDQSLNIDPTEEDSWTWGANATNSTLYYQAFDRNGRGDADGKNVLSLGGTKPAMQNLIGNLTNLMFNKNGKFTFNPAAQGIAVTRLVANGKEPLNATSICLTIHTGLGTGSGACTKSITQESTPVTFIETGGVNTGTFGNWDGASLANIKAVNNPVIRGASATYFYNDVSQSIVGGFGFGSISVTATNGTWNSGQKIPVTLVDADANKNSRLAEFLDLDKNSTGLISAMTIGSPFTLATGDSALLTNSSIQRLPKVGKNTILQSFNATRNAFGPQLTIHPFSLNDTGGLLADQFSQRAILEPHYGATNHTATILPNSTLIIDLGGRTVGDLQKVVLNNRGTAATKFKGFDFFNFDLRALTDSRNNATGNTAITKGSWYLLVNTTSTTAPLAVSGIGSLTDQGYAKQGPTQKIRAIPIANTTSLQGMINLNGTNSGLSATYDKNNANVINGSAFMQELYSADVAKGQGIALAFVMTGSGQLDDVGKPIVADFFSYGITGDGLTNDQKINNAIYRWELQETGTNTATFTGTTEYTMLNQLNIFDPGTYTQVRPIGTQVKFIAIQDMLQSESRAPQISYLDLGADGQTVTISAQQDVLTHTGVVSFDSKTYKTADTVTITLTDADLNVSNDLVDIYTTVANGTDPASETVGKAGLGTYSSGKSFGRLLDVQFGQANNLWTSAGGCFTAGATATPTPLGAATGLAESGFTLVETGASTGIFTGTFEIPDLLCQPGSKTAVSSTGQNIKVNYVDFRDQSGKTIEISDNAGVRGNTGSITLDKSVYPVPFGQLTDFTGDGNAAKTTPNGRSIFPVHRDQIPSTGITATQTLPNGDLLVHIRVNDKDYSTASTGTSTIAVGATAGGDANHGPVQIAIARQGTPVILGYAGGPAVKAGKIITNETSTTSVSANDIAAAREFGKMTEISPGAGIFQADIPIRFTDGPANSDCPKPTSWTATDGTVTGASTEDKRFNVKHTGGSNFCVRQGDVLTVTYTDQSDASGHVQTVTDSATFDLRNGVLQSDKSVYIIGSDMILTLVEPDLNLDSQTSETVPLDLIEWDSHAYKNTMGPLAATPGSGAFDPKPSTFVETGKDTGIFQSVIKIPKQLGNTLLERGEQIHLEYTDWGPAGSKYVGKDNQDIILTIYTSNFGATVELDQKVYTWTDRVYITVVAPDHNFDPNLIDTIGDSDSNKVVVSTRGNSISPYKLVETGVDTGIFTGYVILTGDATLKGTGGVDGAGENPTGTKSGNNGGPTDGFLPAEDTDGVSVSFEFTRDQTVTGSALIRWNIGEIKWLEASYPANGQGVLQIVDPDMNLNPKAVDKFDTNVWSDSDSGGIRLTMTETGAATGIFQGTVYFTTNFQSSGNRLHVAEGDTVTGEYKDRTLPSPYTPADQLSLTSTTFIGTVVPPLERAPASNPRIVDSFGNALTSVKVNQQIQVTADLTNGQDRSQPFAYLVQIQDANGVTVSLSWITGTLTGGQSLNPAQSWTPTASGTYTAQIFVWQSIDNPNALSPPLSTTITVA